MLVISTKVSTRRCRMSGSISSRVFQASRWRTGSTPGKAYIVCSFLTKPKTNARSSPYHFNILPFHLHHYEASLCHNNASDHPQPTGGRRDVHSLQIRQYLGSRTMRKLWCRPHMRILNPPKLVCALIQL